jgi:hypothetical protein
MTALLHGNIGLFNSAILKNIQLPRLINLGLLFVLTILAVVFRDYLHFYYYPWAVFLGLNIVAIALAIPLRYYNRQMLKSLLLLPKVFIKMFHILFRLKGANKSFIHTPHGVRDIPLENKK